MTEAGNNTSEIARDRYETVFIDDKIVRFIGIPFFGMVIPSATGLINPGHMSFIPGALHYLYFILIAWAVWEGNRFLLYRYYPVMLDSHSVFQKYILMLGLNIFYTAPVSFFMLYVWKYISGADHAGSGDILATVAVIVVCVIFVTNVYEKVLFTKHSEREKRRFEQLERTRIEAEMEALKNQIDPHFFFNTLNSISYLIEHDPLRAQKFIENLADVYRYILRSKDKNLVLLRDEVAFLKSYSSLIHLRHDDAFKLNIKLYDTDRLACLIPPVSLMVAVENAVKHNEISGNHHLVVDLEQSGEMITISNQISKRNSVRESTGTGLKNLNERFMNTLGKGIEVISNDGYFKLQLPVLNLKSQ